LTDLGYSNKFLLYKEALTCGFEGLLLSLGIITDAFYCCGGIRYYCDGKAMFDFECGKKDSCTFDEARHT
jgi:hypothetical protein